MYDLATHAAGIAQLNEEERERHHRQFRCFYHEQNNHLIRQCPLKSRPDSGESGSSQYCLQKMSPSQLLSLKAFVLPVIVECSGVSSVPTALIDYGAAGNFINRDTAQWFNIPVRPLLQPRKIQAIDGDPIGGGIISYCTEPLSLQIGALYKDKSPSTSQFRPDILGLPWLDQHNPTISRTDRSHSGVRIVKHIVSKGLSSL